MPEKMKFTARSIAGAVERKIVEEAVAEGVKLPSAAKLALRYGVSVKTADRALNHLVEKGFILRVRGGGNFVRANRSSADRVTAGIIWCGLADAIASLETNPTNAFMEELSRLLAEHNIGYHIFFDRFGPVGQMENRLKKYDVLLMPAGLIQFHRELLEHPGAQVFLYGNDVLDPGPWHQVIYDYRPGMTAALKWCKAHGYRKIFLPGYDSSTARSRRETLVECGLALGFRREDFLIHNAECVSLGSSVIVGSRCAEYFLEKRLFDHLIFSVSDFFTYGMLDFFNRHKLSYGRDYQLISYDNFQSYLESSNAFLNVSAVTHPLIGHARAAVAMIEDVTRRKETGFFRTYITPAAEFVVRGEDLPAKTQSSNRKQHKETEK